MVDTEVQMIGDFAVRVGDTDLDVPPTMRRLIAYLAVCGHPVSRSRLAALIWPDSPDDRARANLRAAFWRVEELREHVVCAHEDAVRLSDSASVDLVHMRRRCVTALRADRVSDDLGQDPRLLVDLCSSLAGDWIMHDRERWRQLRLHVIVRYLEDLRDCGRHDEGVDLAERAARSAPALESIAALRTPVRPATRAQRQERVLCGRGPRSEPIHPTSCSQPKEAPR